MVSKAGKMLLKNTIQSLEHQNKVREEKEMWNKLKNERRVQKVINQRQDYHKRKYTDEDISESKDKRSKTSDSRKPDNYWLKKLIAEEEKLSNERWTHNGFKELYSEEFQSKSSSDEEITKKKIKKKKKKSKKHKHKKNKNKRKD